MFLMVDEPNIEVFVKIKDEIITLSNELFDLVRYEPEKDANNDLIYDFNEDLFIKDLNMIQSKLSILCSIANTRRSNLDWLDEGSQKMIGTVDRITNAEHHKLPLKYVYERGVLWGLVRSYLLCINSHRFDLQKKRFRINLKSIGL